MATLLDRNIHNRSTYSNYGCRCPECSSDWAAYIAERKAARVLERKLDDQGHVIGRAYSASTYGNWSCRCGKCTTAHSNLMRWMRRSRKRREEK